MFKQHTYTLTVTDLNLVPIQRYGCFDVAQSQRFAYITTALTFTPNPAPVHKISAQDLWAEHVAAPLSFLSDPIMLDWDAYELSLHNISRLEQESNLAIHITRGRDGRISSVCFSSVLTWTLGPECAATIYSSASDMVVAHVVHMLMGADPTWAFVPLFYPMALAGDGSIAALQQLAHREPSAAYRGGATVFEASVAGMRERFAGQFKASL